MTKKKKEKKRIPRIAGLTQKMKAIHLQKNKTKKKRLKESLKKELLRRYLIEGYSINGVRMNVEEVSFYLGISLRQVVKGISETMGSMAGLTKDGGMEEAYRALMAMGIQGALADRGLVQQQAHDLLRSQGNQYQPFMSTAVNQSLKNLLDSQKPILELIKALNPQGGITINNNNQQAQGQYLSTAEAVKLIDKSRDGLLQDPEAQHQLGESYGVEDFPEVVATKQRGFRLEDDAIMVKTSKPTEHETRREEE